MHVAQSQLVGTRISTATVVNLLSGIGQTNFASAHGHQSTDQQATAVVVGAAGVVLSIVGHDFGYAKIVLTAQIPGLDTAVGSALGVREGQSHVDGAVGVANASTQFITALLIGIGKAGHGVVAWLLAKTVLHLAVEAAQVAWQKVADRVALTHNRALQAVSGGTCGSRIHAVQGLGRAHTIRAERIEHSQVPELGRVVTAQADFTEATIQADGGAALEGQTIRIAIVVAESPFQPERSRQTDMYWLIGFMVNSFVRPSDIRTLRHRHIEVVRRDQKSYLRLTLPTTKKHDKPIVTLQPAVRIYERLHACAQAAHAGQPDDYLFLPAEKDRAHALAVLNFWLQWVLREAGIPRIDVHGQARTLYCLRHTSITFRLLYGEGIDMLTLARNARTSVAMIESFYASSLTGEMNVGMLQSRRTGRSR